MSNLRKYEVFNKNLIDMIHYRGHFTKYSRFSLKIENTKIFRIVQFLNHFFFYAHINIDIIFNLLFVDVILQSHSPFFREQISNFMIN